jgi:uncharacterized protein (TIGR03085 family)
MRTKLVVGVGKRYAGRLSCGHVGSPTRTCRPSRNPAHGGTGCPDPVRGLDDALPGLLFGPLASYTARVQTRLATSTTWEDLVDLFASGPPLLSLFKVLDPVASIHEMFVHHEDVRRAQTGWEPRELDAGTGAAVKRRVAMISRAGMSKSMTAVRARLTLRTPDGQAVVAVGRGSPVTVTGEPLELLLFAFGRNAVRVDFGGDDDIVAAVRAAKRGF